MRGISHSLGWRLKKKKMRNIGEGVEKLESYSAAGNVK